MTHEKPPFFIKSHSEVFGDQSLETVKRQRRPVEDMHTNLAELALQRHKLERENKNLREELALLEAHNSGLEQENSELIALLEDKRAE